MKKTIIISLVLAYAMLLSCNTNAQDSSTIENRTLTMLIDCTSEKLYNDIDVDIRTNLPDFLRSTGIADISFEQKFTMKVGFIESSGNLTLAKESIALPKQREVSKHKATELRNPRTIMQMIDNQLVTGKAIAATKQTRSPIVEVILKSLREMHAESQEELLLIFSDGVEYSASDAVNFFKNIPYSDDTFERYYEKLDPFILQEAISKIAESQPHVVFYLKTSEEGVNKADLKRFYSKLFERIGITDFQFLDNLTQNVQNFDNE